MAGPPTLKGGSVPDGRPAVTSRSARAQMWREAVEGGGSSSSSSRASSRVHAVSPHTAPPAALPGVSKTSPTPTVLSAAEQSKMTAAEVGGGGLRRKFMVMAGVACATAVVLVVLNPPMTQVPAEDTEGKCTHARSVQRIMAWSLMAAALSAWCMIAA